MLRLALSAISQRALIALVGLRTILLVASMFWAAMAVLKSPTDLQLIGLGIYGVFLITIEVIANRKFRGQ